MNAQVTFEVGLSRKHLQTDLTLKENLGRHVNHLEMHFQNVLILVNKNTNVQYNPTKHTHSGKQKLSSESPY